MTSGLIEDGQFRIHTHNIPVNLLIIYLYGLLHFLYPDDTDYLFVSMKSNPIRKDTIHDPIKKHAQVACISCKLSSHSFRKYLATSLIRSNANPAAVQQGSDQC